ncbi:MAG: flagellar basal body P-ring protein FlgI, partial [Chromatiales bacterium]|nr:flagellar basal body P-ring protein FlgI [Chromatiales bacterium]
MSRKLFLGCLAVFAAAVGGVAPVYAERIKDLVSISGVRDNQLVGYGLVVGLPGTGDQTTQAPFTTQSLKSMLNRLGVTVPANVNPQLKNVAAVAVHAKLPPFFKPGQNIDIAVSSIGNAKSLRGGSLLLTPLQGIDGKVYAIAQGNLVVGGLSVDAEGGTSVTVNIPSAGRIPNGATVERSVPTPFGVANTLTLNLHRPDFTTVRRVVAAVSAGMGAGVATPIDGASISLRMPRSAAQHVEFISMVENLEVEPAEAAARIVVNSRTGTVVIGRHVRVLAAAVSHGNLSVTVSNEQQVSQPAPLSPQGQTTVVNQ